MKRPRISRKLIAAFEFLIILVLTITSSCTSPDQPPDLLVAAASSLAPVFNELGPLFSAESGFSVTFSYASTGHLAQQINNGAPFDLFAAADALHIDALIKAGYLDENSRMEFASGTLVLAVGREAELGSLNDLMSCQDGKVAIANPEHAPYGLAAKQVLERVGLWAQIKPHLVVTETVRQATQVVETGNACAGLVSKTTTLDSDLRIIEIDPGLYDRIRHVSALAVESKHADAAISFLEFLHSPTGATILKKYGLEPSYGR